MSVLRLLSRRVLPTTRMFSASAVRALEPPSHLDERELTVFKKLDEAFQPSRLEVQDVSGGCGSMYAIEIQSKRFNDIRSVNQHRLVNEVLKDEIKEWHGIQLRTKHEDKD